MRKVKILHCADIHFDSAFKELDKNISLKSREELLENFKKVIDLVLLEKVQILLIAGDLFDNMSLSKSTMQFIINEFSRIKNTHIFISPGNHDPYNRKSFYKLIQWPSNVYIFKGNMENIIIEELGVVVWGSGFTSNYQREPLFNKINVDSNYINIMVIHGELCSNESSNEYNPIYIKNIENSKINYIALGHRHSFSGILKKGITDYAYCGCLSGRGFDEVGQKGVIIGEVYENCTDLKFLPVSKRQYIIKEINLKNISTYEEIKREILSSINEEERKNNIYKIVLKGYIKEYFILNEKVLYEKIKNDFYFVKIENKTKVEINLIEISRDYSLRGKYVLLMMDKLKGCTDEEEKEIVSLALKLGLQCLCDEEVTLDDD